MKKFTIITMFLIAALGMQSCGTIVGGAKYYAKVQVEDNPNAKIYYQGQYKGTGEANFKVKRRNADKFSVTIKEKGKEDFVKNYTQRSFRGWAFVGTVVGWTGTIATAPYILPWGVATDIATGSLWKPDISEKGVSKEDMKHFVYTVRVVEREVTGPKTELEASKVNEEGNKSK